MHECPNIVRFSPIAENRAGDVSAHASRNLLMCVLNAFYV